MIEDLKVVDTLFALIQRAEASHEEFLRTERAQNLDEIAGISHEMRTPLTLIKGPTEALQNQYSDPNIQAWASMVSRNAGRLLRLTDQLLDFSQLHLDYIKTKKLYRVKETVESVVLAFDQAAEAKGLKLKAGQIDDAIVSSIPDGLEKIVSNLLDNAIKYTPKGGSIQVTVTLASNEVSIAVQDSGPGLSKEEISQIFDKFYRVFNINQSIQGTGIGLALVHKLVSHQGGVIKVESEVGQGTCFIVVLPVVSQESMNAEGKDLKADGPNQQWLSGLQAERLAWEQADINNGLDLKEQQSSGHEYSEKSEIGDEPDRTNDDRGQVNSVLVVEDNPEMLRFIESILSPHYRCFMAKNGEEGLGVARETLPDLIISDVMMPLMDGFELVRALRSDKSLNHIPIILLSAQADEESRLQGWLDFADDYITKPFDARSLKARIDSMLAIRVLLQNRSRQALINNKQEEKNRQSDENSNETDLHQEFMLTIQSILADNYADPNFNAKQLSEALDLPSWQVLRKVKAVFGQKPIDLIRLYRLEQAAMLLKKQTQVTAVMYSCGFQSSSYFAKCFKAQYGKTPSEYATSAE